MEEIALGRLGMSERELFDISPRSLINKMNGAQYLENQKWERMRLHAYFSIMPYMDKKKPISPQALIKFPWETSPKVDKKTIEEKHKRANELWARIDATKKRDVEQ